MLLLPTLLIHHTPSLSPHVLLLLLLPFSLAFIIPPTSSFTLHLPFLYHSHPSSFLALIPCLLHRPPLSYFLILLPSLTSLLQPLPSRPSLYRALLFGKVDPLSMQTGGFKDAPRLLLHGYTTKVNARKLPTMLHHSNTTTTTRYNTTLPPLRPPPGIWQPYRATDKDHTPQPTCPEGRTRLHTCPDIPKSSHATAAARDGNLGQRTPASRKREGQGGRKLLSGWKHLGNGTTGD